MAPLSPKKEKLPTEITLPSRVRYFVANILTLILLFLFAFHSIDF